MGHRKGGLAQPTCFEMKCALLLLNKGGVERFVASAIRLYEQEPGEPLASARLGVYAQRWLRWVRAGLTEGCSGSGRPALT